MPGINLRKNERERIDVTYSASAPNRVGIIASDYRQYNYSNKNVIQFIHVAKLTVHQTIAFIFEKQNYPIWNWANVRSIICDFHFSLERFTVWRDSRQMKLST